MANAHSDEYLTRKLTRTEYNLLSADEKRERLKVQKRIGNIKFRKENPEYKKERGKKYREEHKEQLKQYRDANKEKIKERSKQYSKENPEKIKEYRQSPAGKKSHTISCWKNRGLDETEEEMERLYELYLTQKLCSSCECVLTRNGDRSSTEACLDHNHTTNRFRQICCRACNSFDRWKNSWVEGIYGGTKVPPDPTQ